MVNMVNTFDLNVNSDKKNTHRIDFHVISLSSQAAGQLLSFGFEIKTVLLFRRYFRFVSFKSSLIGILSHFNTTSMYAIM